MTHEHASWPCAAVVAVGRRASAPIVYLRQRRDRAASSRAGWRPISSSSAPTRRAASRRCRCAKAMRSQTGAPLFTLDADLQRAAVAENEAAVVNARQAYDRAQELLKRNVGSQKAFDDAEAALRTAEARLNSARTRLERRRVQAPPPAPIQEVYFREGERCRPGGPIVSLLPPGNVRVRFFVPQAMLPTVHIGDRIAVRCDGCAERPGGARQLHLGAGRVHAAGHLQPGGARAPGVPRRGDARAARRICASASRCRSRCKAAAGVSHAAQVSAANGAVAVEVEGLTKSFDGKVVVRNLSMRVMRGQIYGFLGPNGSGKTTTLRMVCGLLTPDGGRGTALGYDILHRARQDQAPRRLHDAALQPLPGPLHPGEPGVRRPRLRPRRSRAGGARRHRAARPAGPRAASSPARCRAAGSSAWRSAPASCPSPSCCCSTSRPPASTPRRGASSGARSTSSPPRA